MSDKLTVEMTAEEVRKLMSSGISDTCEMRVERCFFYTAAEDEQDDQCQWVNAWVCSECHKPVFGVVSPRGILRPNYCPNCGREVAPEWSSQFPKFR